MRDKTLGFLLLTSMLGDPERKPLTTAQLRNLTFRTQVSQTGEPDREMVNADVLAMGYDSEMARHILDLLAETAKAEKYLENGLARGCIPICRNDSLYPLKVRRRLGLDSPGCLWMKGDFSLLQSPAISLVGNRDLRPENAKFAREVGRQAAEQGIVLISGNAKGADNAAQEACLEAGGRIICIVASELYNQSVSDNVLYISEEDYDAPFSAYRALRRNRVIHAMGTLCFVAQCLEQKGGTWDGTVKNLRGQWSPVICCRDGSSVSQTLESMGARLADPAELACFQTIADSELSLFDRQ